MKKRGFTLIELLVVIAIIAILAAILFPVFAQAREKARQITCVSNEKEIGLGILMYEQDYDEDYPMLHYNDANGNEVRWMDAVAPYIKNGTIFANDGYYTGAGGIWDCPDAPNANQDAQYGVNWFLMREGVGYPEYNGTVPTAGSVITIKDGSVDSPSETILLCEKGGSDPTYPTSAQSTSWLQMQIWPGMWTNEYNTAAPSAVPTTPWEHLDTAWDCDLPAGTGLEWNNCSLMPRYRHNGTSNFLFADGHVKAIQKGQVNFYTNVVVAGDIPPGYP